MNVWKPIALCSAAGLVLSVGLQVASAAKSAAPLPPLAGDPSCHGQPNMAGALSNLTASLASLRVAEHDKQGWRTAAIASTEAALAKTNQGCAMAP
jgi:hypothetical protein